MNLAFILEVPDPTRLVILGEIALALPSAKAAQQNIASASGLESTPPSTSTTSTNSAHASGTRKLRRALASVARRQVITGPMPLSSTRISANGTV